VVPSTATTSEMKSDELGQVGTTKPRSASCQGTETVTAVPK